MPVQTTYSVDPDSGIEGMLDNGTMRNGDVKTMFNGAAAEIGFGRAVKRGSATDGRDARLPTTENDAIVGILAHSHSYENGPLGDLGTVGVKQGGKLNILRKGRIFVTCEDGCAPGDRLWVRAVAAGDPEFLGGLNSADDSTDMVDCTAQGEWQSFAAAGARAWLEVDFTNK